MTALTFPWQTRDPFLFCAYHNDSYPTGNDQLGPAASLAGRAIGQDFDPSNAWRMYHGAAVPGFPQHPHRGFETVTIVHQGCVDHSDWTLLAANPGVNRTLYFYAGSNLSIGGETIPSSHMLALKPDVALPLRAGSELAQLFLLEGRPIREPVAHSGPFVMNTREELKQAFTDYQRTQFGGWPWSDAAPVHARQEGRFAKHADGRLEKPV